MLTLCIYGLHMDGCALMMKGNKTATNELRKRHTFVCGRLLFSIVFIFPLAFAIAHLTLSTTSCEMEEANQQ